MPEQIVPDLYRIEVPLPHNPLRAVNSYVIKGRGRDMIVDTGMNREECLLPLAAGLAALEVDLDHADLFATHLHADHYGLVPRLARPTSRVYFNRPDAAIIKAGGRWAAQLDYARRSGFPADLLQTALQRHPGYRYTAYGDLDFQLVADGDVIVVGDYTFVAIQTPGHTPGHTCLYEPAKKILLAGDHVLEDITPNISSWLAGENPLRDYLASLDRVYDLDVTLVLPGHRRAFTDLRGRIDELRRHHEERAAEILAILREGALDAYMIASRMTWDMTYPTWQEFPVPQQWFATGEAIAHLKYLEAEGAVRRDERGDVVRFLLA